MDLEDDDLDLGGDDFAGELDEMMGDDELGGDSGGGDDGDSDSELDSFFEDLSSIEDMDEGGGEPADDVSAVAAVDDDVEEAPAKKEKKPKAPKEKSGGGKLKFILLFLLLLGGGLFAAWWFLFRTEQIPEEDLQVIEQVPTQTLVFEKPVKPKQPVVQPIQPKVLELEPEPVKPVVPTRRYLIQVAKCSYDVCKEDTIEAIRREGEPVFQKSSGEKYDFIELISKQVFSYRDATEVARQININNKMAGNANVRHQANGYRVSMGMFPALDRAKEVKFNVENIFPGKNVTFLMEHRREDYSTTKIYAGPYDSRNEAKAVLKSMRSKKKFRGAFIVLY